MNNILYIPIFERDCENFLHSNGAYSPELHLEDCTIGKSIERIGEKKGKLGKSYIAKLIKHQDNSDTPESPVFIVTASDGVEEKSIIWERCGSNTVQVLRHYNNGMKSNYGDVTFYTIESIELFSKKKLNYFE